jgi:Xaa-Pro dipeptidase
LRLSESAAAAFRRRQARLAAWLAESGIHACVIDDSAHQRTSMLRWLCGHPMDGILFAFAAGRTVLVAWDVNMANERSTVDRVIPYASFKRSFRQAAIGVLGEEGVATAAGESAPKKRVEFLEHTSHLRRQELVADLPGAEIVLRADGFESAIRSWRTIKEPAEIAAIQKAAEITNTLIERIEEMLVKPRRGAGLREIDAAQLLEREALSLGAEGMGFETLAAGPARSWAIHPFPSFSRGPFATPGLSLLDFGVKLDGYSSDVTLTVARGRLSTEQQRMLGLVADAYAAALQAARPGASPRAPAKEVDDLFAAAGWKMPHAVGHGIGLDVHEAPLLKNQDENADRALLPGMIFTIEPGLYHPEHGGVRWENDVLMTETGPQVLTRARIIRIR